MCRHFVAIRFHFHQFIKEFIALMNKRETKNLSTLFLKSISKNNDFLLKYLVSRVVLF